MFLEGKQIILLYALHCIFNVVACDALMMHLLLSLLCFSPRYLGHKFMDEIALFMLAACHVHFVVLLWSWRPHQVLITLRLLEDLGH